MVGGKWKSEMLVINIEENEGLEIEGIACAPHTYPPLSFVFLGDWRRKADIKLHKEVIIMHTHTLSKHQIVWHMLLPTQWTPTPSLKIYAIPFPSFFL